jgi:hypothetical protein
MRILWPNIPPEFEPVARDAIGASFEDVTDEQWEDAGNIVGAKSPAVAASST